jgi:FHA domain-containing protein
MPPAAGLQASSKALTPQVPAAAAKRLPDDFDPFASLPGVPVVVGMDAPVAAPAPRGAGNYFDDLIPMAPGAVSIDALFDLQASHADPLADFMSLATPSPAAPADTGLSTDPLQALFGDAGPPASPPAQPDHLPALNAAFSPPRVAVLAPAAALGTAASSATPSATSSATAPPRTLPVAAPSDTRLAGSAWAALCVGAGVTLPQPAEMSDAQWQLVGRLLHSAVEGTVRLMAVRASTKHELRAEVTVIQARDNNPLKFSPDARTALEYLLQAPTRGFLDGPAAMDDAMHDLVGHAIGTVAGMRAAIDGMLSRFAPQALESKLTSKSVLDSLLPAQRKARLWDLYVQHHHSIRSEAQEDFHSLFGKAFLAAYEQQIEQLKRGAPPA